MEVRKRRPSDHQRESYWQFASIALAAILAGSVIDTVIRVLGGGDLTPVRVILLATLVTGAGYAAWAAHASQER